MNDNQEYSICSPLTPMPKGDKGRWAHINVREIGEQEDGYPSGDIVRKCCDDCGHSWTEELPQ